MIKRILLFLWLGFSINNYAQEQDAWVYFTDKPNASSYLNNPLSMLTQRALDRRAAQNISLQINDVPVEQSYIDAVENATGITVKAKSKWLNCVHVRGTQADIQNVSTLVFVDHIVFANASLNKLAFTNTSPVNKQLDVQTNFNYGNSGSQIQMLNGHILHQQNYTGAGKIIAVLDSGFINVNTTVPFQRMYANNLYLGGYNFVNNSTDVYALHNHGTMVLSTMVGYVDGQLVGTAPDAQYYLYVTEDVTQENPVEESYWVAAAEEADRVGADVITSSLGYFAFDNPAYGHSYNDMTGNSAFASRGANIAFSKGMVVLASAGNSGGSSQPHVGVPAEATNVLAVGAVQPNETVASFSSIGPSFDGRIKPNLMAQGQGDTVATTSGTLNNNGAGTSFACPILAGAITSFWSAFPNLTNQEVVNLVKQSADRFNNPNNTYGYGIPDFQLALTNALSSSTTSAINLKVYPNPVSDTLYISENTILSNAYFTLYNILGQEILSTVLNTNAISVASLQSGTYIYKVQTDNQSFIGKMIKK
jgi:hypothetical protein